MVKPDAALEAAMKKHRGMKQVLRISCGGDWDRVVYDPRDGSFTTHNNKLMADRARARITGTVDQPVSASLQLVWKSAEDIDPCERCKSRAHETRLCDVPPAVEVVEVERPKLVPAPEPKRKMVSVDMAELANALGVKKVVEATTTIVTQPKKEHVDPSVWVPPTGKPFDWEQVDLKQSTSRFAQQWARGLPAGVGFSYLPDVLALWGLDTELTEAVLRNPESVEVRPESFHTNKRYPVLGFKRGDVQVILGMRDPVHPCIIAVYVASRLEADEHRVNHHGGGAGGKSETGLPKTAGQLRSRLEAAGCDLRIDLDKQTAEVTYKGRSLGKVNVDRHLPRAAVETEWQRTQRRIAGVDRAVSA